MTIKAIEWLVEKSNDGIFDGVLPTRMVNEIFRHVWNDVPDDMKVVKKRFINWHDGTTWYTLSDHTGQRFSKAKYERNRTHINFEYGPM